MSIGVKTVMIVNNIKDLSTAEIFGILAMDSYDNPTLKDCVYSLMGKREIKYDSNVCLTVCNEHYAVKMYAREDFLNITWTCRDNNLYFVNSEFDNDGIGSIYFTEWSIDELKDYIDTKEYDE